MPESSLGKFFLVLFYAGSVAVLGMNDLSRTHTGRGLFERHPDGGRNITRLVRELHGARNAEKIAGWKGRENQNAKEDAEMEEEMKARPSYSTMFQQLMSPGQPPK